MDVQEGSVRLRCLCGSSGCLRCGVERQAAPCWSHRPGSPATLGPLLSPPGKLMQAGPGGIMGAGRPVSGLDNRVGVGPFSSNWQTGEKEIEGDATPQNAHGKQYVMAGSNFCRIDDRSVVFTYRYRHQALSDPISIYARWGAHSTCPGSGQAEGTARAKPGERS